MKLKINITKGFVVKLAVFTALVAAAFILDVYFGNHPAELEKIQAETHEHNTGQDAVYLISQITPNTIKTYEDKASSRLLQVKLHDKFLRHYYSVRNNQVLKAEVVKQTTPLISSYHYLVYQNHIFSPDEESIG